MKRNKFSLSHYKLLTLDMGQLVPLTWFEVLPGDSIQQATSCLVRCSPLMAPVMHPVRVRIHHWFVPYRLIWDDWEDFITGGPDGNDATVVPHFTLDGDFSTGAGTLLDYLGVPPVDYTGKATNFSMLPLRAYNTIWNEHYRDQDLVTEAVSETASGLDLVTNGQLLRVAWEKDYFTTARPWEQKGDAVLVPIGDSAPVTGNVTLSGSPVLRGYGYQTGTQGASGNPFTDFAGNNIVSPWTAPNWGYDNANKPRVQLSDGSGTIAAGAEADLSAAAGVTVNDLRLALALQRYQEARAHYGSRYVEYLRYLGVRSSDARLQSPEYLGGGRQTIQFSEVLQTAEGVDPVGAMKGHGIAAMRSNRYRRFFEEHGLVMSMMSVVPKTIYTQAIHKKWLRTVKEDYYQRELEAIGEQEIQKREVYAAQSDPAAVFGYQARYDEYRSHPSSIAGEFHTTLDHWHYGRVHTGDIALNSSFIQAVPTKRTNADMVNHVLYVMANHSIQARRMMRHRAITRTF